MYLLGEVNKDTPVKMSDEHQDYKWLSLDEACELVEHQTLQGVLKECEEFLKNRSVLDSKHMATKK